MRRGDFHCATFAVREDDGERIVRQLRTLSVLLAVVLAVLLSGIVVTAATVDLPTTFNQNANIRAEPSPSADRLGLGRAGQAFRLDGRITDGTWVRGITSNGTVGWVVSGVVNITAGDLVGLRIITPATPFTLGPASAPAAAAPAVAGDAGTGITATSSANLNVRSGPGTGYRRIGGITLGGLFTVDGKDATGGWARGITTAGIIGWSSTAYLNFAPGEFNTLPVVTIDTPFGAAAPGAPAPVEAAPGAPDVPLPPPVVGTSAVTGFSYGGHVLSLNDFVANWMRVAGMSWVKKQVRYVDGQNPGDYAGLINQIKGSGFRVLLGVVGFNKNDINNPGYNERYASFVAGLAALGTDAIELWNEPNIASEWPDGQIDAGRYVQLLAASYNAIKSTNPNTMVISGAPAPTGFFGGCSGFGCDDNAYLAAMAAAGAANYMDCVGVHYNEGVVPPTWTSGDPRGNSGYYTRYFRPMMDVYSGAFGGRKPLCFTEMGYLSGEGYPPLPGGFAWAVDTSVAEQAAWLDQAVSIARNSGRVRIFIIWNVDFTIYGADPQAGFAMIRPGGDCPACRALGS